MPGCGKSTVSHLVAEALRQQGKTVLEPTYELDHLYSAGRRKVIKLIKLALFAVRQPIQYRSLCRLVEKNGYTGFSKLTQAANIAAKLLVYESGKADWILFDEGLTQSAISLASGGKRSSAENEAALYALSPARDVRKLFLKVGLETAMARMASRDRHDSRIDKIADESRKIQEMRTFKAQCESISSAVITNDGTSEDCAARIVELLWADRE